VRIGTFTTHAERVGAEDHAQEALLREPLDEQPVLGQEPRVVDADAVAEEALHVAAVGGVEAHAGDRRGDRGARVARSEVRARGALRELAALALGEVHDVDGCEILLDQILERLVQRRLAVLEVERHGRVSECTCATPRCVKSASCSSIDAVLPIVADINRNWLWRSTSSGICHAIPRSRSS
jgi:hypothetical protein